MIIAMTIVITFNFISLKSSFLCYYKSHLPKIYLVYSTWTSLRDSPILNLKALRDTDSFISLGTKSHIFGPRQDTDSVPCQTEFALLLLKELLLRRSYGLILGGKVRSFIISGAALFLTLNISIQLLELVYSYDG